MSILSRIRAWFAAPSTPAIDNLERELRHREIREITPLQFSLKASEASQKQSLDVLQFYRDQRNAGVDHNLALYRARCKITGAKS